ncbi:MAG: hypothetical protein L3J86_03190 [Thermoplasmata archaeon]|nr:hypothetical protein [Thermoplasmata archaeon]
MPGKLAHFVIDLDVRASPAEVRRWTFESVTGGETEPGESGQLEVLESGKDRCAARYTLGIVSQLRVVEWSSPEHAVGTIERRRQGRPDLTARFVLEATPTSTGTRLHLEYSVGTPLLLLELYLRLGGGRRLALRLAESWRRFDRDPPSVSTPN